MTSSDIVVGCKVLQICSPTYKVVPRPIRLGIVTHDSSSKMMSAPDVTFIPFHWHEQDSTIPCRSQELLPFLYVIYFSCHPSPPTILPSFLTSCCHLFLGVPLNLVVPNFIYNTLLGILFSSILCPCPNQCNLQDVTYHKKNSIKYIY